MVTRKNKPDRLFFEPEEIIPEIVLGERDTPFQRTGVNEHCRHLVDMPPQCPDQLPGRNAIERPHQFEMEAIPVHMGQYFEVCFHDSIPFPESGMKTFVFVQR
jgi:hypothetical protein